MNGSRRSSVVSADSDDEFVESDVFPSTPGSNSKTMLKHTTESIATWVEEYLTASKYGRLAYAAGDRQLATDRFNLALDIELQAELDSMGDFGVTGNRLRMQLQARSNGRHRLQTKATSRYSVVLGKLKGAYELAVDGATKGNNPTDPRHFLQMGAALCCINEWEKARKTYQDGLACCGNCKELTLALEKLDTIENLLMPEQQRHKRKDAEKKQKILQSPSSSPMKVPSGKKKRPASMAVMEDPDGPVLRSRSFYDIKEYTSMAPDRRKSSPITNKGGKNLVKSPLTTKRSIPQPGMRSPFSSPATARRGRWNPFRKASKLPELPTSWSDEDLSAIADNGTGLFNPEWEAWKMAFDPSFFSLDDELNSRTIEYMRLLSTLPDTDSEEEGDDGGEGVVKSSSLSYDDEGESTDSDLL